jgi:fluoroquinolone resistance protein
MPAQLLRFQLHEIPGIKILGCEAKEVDFTEADLSNADLQNTDFENSRFYNTNLSGAIYAERGISTST